MAQAARKNDADAPRQRRGAHLRVVEDKPGSAGRTKKSVSGATRQRSVAKKVATPKAAAKTGRPAKTTKPAKARMGKTVRQNKAVRAAAPNKTSPARGAARTRPRPAAFSADGLIGRATQAVLPTSCEESPLTALCRTSFRVFMVGLVLVAAFGMVRVTLSAQAAEASALSQKVKAELRTERERSETLELYKGALMQPSRVESMAAEAGMTRPGNVRYIALPKQIPAAPVAPADATSRKSTSMLPEPVGAVLEAAAKISAREAQVLLASGSALGGPR